LRSPQWMEGSFTGARQKPCRRRGRDDHQQRSQSTTAQADARRPTSQSPGQNEPAEKTGGDARAQPDALREQTQGNFVENVSLIAKAKDDQQRRRHGDAEAEAEDVA